MNEIERVRMGKVNSIERPPKPNDKRSNRERSKPKKKPKEKATIETDTVEISKAAREALKAYENS